MTDRDIAGELRTNAIELNQSIISAANEIDRLKAECEKYREALEYLCEEVEDKYPDFEEMHLSVALTRARAALNSQRARHGCPV